MIAASLLATVGGAVAGLTHGATGIAAFMLGLGVGAVGVAGLAMLTKLLASVAAERGSQKRGVALTLSIFAIKIPVILVIAMSIQRWGNGAVACFSGAILLVYFLLVVGAASTTMGSE